jgi:predicted RNA-binding Zn ribbon-like protein
MSIDQINLVGGHICLDFMNSVGHHLTDQPGEHLHSYSDWVAWAQHAGVISDSEAARLTHLAAQQPDSAEQALAIAISLRETIFRLLVCAVRGQSPDSADLLAFNQALAEVPVRTTVIHDGTKYRWQIPDSMTSLQHILWRLLWPAADLLTSDQMTRVKICEAEGCGWMFLDTSRNQSRRWCSMADCGNRAKADRYYKRHKGE